MPLPIGISFFVFHNISLLVDIAKSQALVPKLSVKNAMLYLSFFPQLVSGPIARASAFLPQITPKVVRDVPIVDVAKWVVVGYFFKLYVANNLNQLTSNMSPPIFETIGGADRLMLLFLYSFQIYADFFGYSAIAVGLGLLFGYRLPLNFRCPYIASSFSEFWSRWHISLSMWLRTYLYIPLGGNQLGRARTYANLMIVMALGGLWHGAGLNYIAWGILHGLFLVCERPFLSSGVRVGHLQGIVRVSRIGFVFVCVSAAWVCFKMPTFADAASYVSGIFILSWRPGFPKGHYLLAAVYSAPVVIQHGWALLRGEDAELSGSLEASLYGALVALTVMEAGPDSAFIYFQF